MLLVGLALILPAAAVAKSVGELGDPGDAAAAIRFPDPPPSLRHGTPAEAGLAAEPLTAIDEALAAGLTATPHPRFPGAVAVAGRNGVVAYERAVGDAVRYADDQPTELPAADRYPMRTDTIFDVASLSKLFTSAVAMRLVERGDLELDAPVARWIPEFAAGGKASITVRHLLAHTSGLPAYRPLWRDEPTREARLDAVYASAPGTRPGMASVYSDLNMIVLGELVAEAGGKPLDEQVAEGITGPLGMRDTMYHPPAELRARIAATEFQSATGRGLVWGAVHDENAWSLGGISGHAGVFSTARDLAVFAQMLLNGGTHDGARVLRPDTVREIVTAQPGTSGRRGLGLELNQPSYMGELASPVTAGHTGFTGTSLVIDPTTRSFAILLTNRVHPSREWGSINPTRRAVADAVGRAVATAST